MLRSRYLILAAGLAGLAQPAFGQALYAQPETTGSIRPRVVSGIGPELATLPDAGTSRPVTVAAAGPSRGAYGGGFIELLMTGRDPTPARRGAIYNDPEAGLAPVSPPSRSLDRAGPVALPETQITPGRARTAATAPDDGDTRPIARVLPDVYRKQVVDYDGRHAPGTIVIDTPRKFLFLVQPGGKALRYGIGVGRPGFEWAGVKSVTMKREWPDWRPPAQMLKRRPDLPRYMAGGPDNPLGARAMYLGSSLYRIHGTNEPHTIGQAVSSGCIRMTNDDVTDLYNRVKVGAKVVVM